MSMALSLSLSLYFANHSHHTCPATDCIQGMNTIPRGVTVAASLKFPAGPCKNKVCEFTRKYLGDVTLQLFATVKVRV